MNQSVPKIDDFATQLDSLDTRRLAYVTAQVATDSITQALKDAGIAKATFYKWPDREEMVALANQLKRAVKYRAMRRLEDAVDAAAETLVLALDSDNPHVQVKSAVEILDRVISKPTQKVDIEVTDVRVTRASDVRPTHDLPERVQ